MKALSLAEIAEIVDGELYAPQETGSVQVSQIITDSRKAFDTSNALFFALRGPFNNGHLYINDLIDKGLKAFVVSEKSATIKDAAFILVPDTTRALQKLAAHIRRLYSYPVVGITGSNGKTIVKEWIHDILSPAHNLVRSPKSYNSQIGVPLSVLLMEELNDIAIFEAGISQPNEMAALENVIAPTIGVLTNIGDAHQENFSSPLHKLQEKLLLFKNCGILVYRNDSRLIREELNRFLSQHQIKAISWSAEGLQSVIQFSLCSKENNTEIVADFRNERFTFTIPFTDDSAIENACHCFAVLFALEKNPNDYLDRFQLLHPVAMRLEIKQGINSCVLINDYYNSDLNSLSIALSVLKQQAAKHHLQQLVILSDIQQTGIENRKLYGEVNTLLKQWGINKIIGIGPEISASKSEFTIHGEFYSSRGLFEQKLERSHFNSSAILIKGARNFTFEKISGLLQEKSHQTVLEINLNAIIHNFTAFRKLLNPKTKIMVMVKAFSYGSGDVEVARLLQYQNVDYLAVAVADEGVLLRKSGINVPIVVMNPEKDSFFNLIEYKLEPNIYSIELLNDFSRSVSEEGQKEYPIHIKVDTGMNRLGLKSDLEFDEALKTLNSSNKIKLKSIFSHLAASDDPLLDDFTHEQINRFKASCKRFEEHLPYSFDKHILNSAGIERFPENQMDMVRLGIGLYGISQTGLPLENISTLLSTVSQVKNLNKEETVGYNRKGRLLAKGKIAIVPLGYADGLDRKLGNGNGYAFVEGKRVPIVGNICMDMLMLDVSNSNVQPGDRVEFFGPNISINEVANSMNTIPYEVLTGISQRVKRIYLQE